MPTLRPNPFTSYEFAPQELEQAAQFNDLQVKYLRTLLSETAEQLINLKFDPANALSVTVEHAYLSGQKEVLETLLNAYNAVASSSSSSQ